MYRAIAAGSTVHVTAYDAMERLVNGQDDRAWGESVSTAIRNDDWAEIERLLSTALHRGSRRATEDTSTEVGILVWRLVQQLETHHAGITLSKKREGLKRALVPRRDNLQEFQLRLTRLIDSWSGAASATPDVDEPANLTASNVFGGLEALAAAEERRSKRIPLDTSGGLVTRLRLMLRLVLDNIAELTPESEMLPIQIEQLERILADPLTEHKLEEAERVLRSLIMRQGTIKHGIEEAKTAAKELASSLIERLTSLSTSAGTYTGKVTQVSGRIAKAENLTQLSQVVMSLLSDTQLMSSDMMRARDDLDAARAHARTLETRTKVLEQELAKASALVRTDPLTTALNRRGFEEAYAQQVNRPSADILCVALLDIDDFKRINDSFGHLVGDDALRYLADIMRDLTRPADAVGRYGGEEFVVLFPKTPVSEAAEIMTRIQRELTKRVFMQDHSRVLLTFSCGITQVPVGESLEQALFRADSALHEAKQKGKNKVVTI